jgi:hypothetical protein
MSVDFHALQRRLLQFVRSEKKSRFRVSAVIACLGVVTAVAIYWAYDEHQKRERPRIVSALVRDASVRFEDALSSGSSNAAFGQRLDQHVIEVERNLLKLRAMDTTSIGELASAADDYLLTTREILKRQASGFRYRLQLSDSNQALRHHMRSDNRTGTWITQAVRTKERVEADYRDYKMTTEALDQLLGLFSASRAKLIPLVDPLALADETAITNARNRAREAFGKITEEVARSGQLNTYR